MSFESIVILVIPRFPALVDVLVALEFILIRHPRPTLPVDSVHEHLCPDNTEFRAGGHFAFLVIDNEIVVVMTTLEIGKSQPADVLMKSSDTSSQISNMR